MIMCIIFYYIGVTNDGEIYIYIFLHIISGSIMSENT